MSKFKIPMAEWLDLIKSIFFPHFQIVQATVSKLVISSFLPKWCNIAGDGSLKVDLSGWINCFRSERWQSHPDFSGELWEPDSRRAKSGASTLFAIVARRLFSVLGVRAAESELISAPRWRRSASQVLMAYLSRWGWQPGCGRGSALREELGPLTHEGCKMNRDAAGSLMKQVELELTEHHLQTAVQILVFFIQVPFLSLFSLVTHIKGSEMPTWPNWKARRSETIKEDND